MSGAARPEALQDFLTATLATMTALATSPEADRALIGITEAMARPAPLSDRPATRQPACRHLEAALTEAAKDARLRPVTEAFRLLEPELEWTCDMADNGSASAGFAQSYAEVTLLGPGGIEERNDIWLGLSLIAPETRYPDHNHSPEEVYLVLSEGDFFREGDGWFTPGPAGSFYNQPRVRHAMRSGAKPLLAIWALRRVPLAGTDGDAVPATV